MKESLSFPRQNCNFVSSWKAKNAEIEKHFSHRKALSQSYSKPKQKLVEQECYFYHLGLNKNKLRSDPDHLKVLIYIKQKYSIVKFLQLLLIYIQAIMSW